MQSLFKHDCEVCDYLGPYGTEAEPMDLWVCSKRDLEFDMIPEVVARYSSSGPDYGSFDIKTLESIGRRESTERYFVAMERAKKMGFI